MTTNDNGNRLLEIEPVPAPPDAVIDAPPSKSLTHRAILLGLLTPHTVIENPLVAADTVASLRLAHALGARTSAEPTTPAGVRLLQTLDPAGPQTIQAKRPGAQERDVPDTWNGVILDDILARVAPETPRALLAARVHLHIEGPERITVAAPRIDLGNSGTTLRLGSALAALATEPITLDGDASLRTRPMAPLLHTLEALGAKTQASDEGRAPLTLHGPLRGGPATIDGRVSSQFISAVLIAGQAMPEGLILELPTTPASRPYIRLTEEMLAAFGGTATPEQTANGTIYRVPPRTASTSFPLEPTRTRVPGDWSSAAFPLVAAALTAGRVRLGGLDPDSPQGDRSVLDVLRAAGCTVEWETDGGGRRIVMVQAPPHGLRPFTHSFTDTPDLFPALAALAARARGTSHLEALRHVRVKETDRVAAMALGLAALGFDVHEEPERVEISGDPTLPIPAATLETGSDHRILMAFAVLGLSGPGPVRLTHPGCYHVSYPCFRLDMDALGGGSHIVARDGDEAGSGMKGGSMAGASARGAPPGGPK